MHTPSSVDIHLGTLPIERGEPKLFHQFGESTRLFTKCTSTAPMPTSSNVLISDHKLVRIHPQYPLVIILILILFLLMTFLLLFARVNALAYLILSLYLYLIHTFLSFHAFISSIDSEQNETWDLVVLPPGKKIDGCWWVFELNPNGPLARLKACLITKGYLQVIGV